MYTETIDHPTDAEIRLSIVLALFRSQCGVPLDRIPATADEIARYVLTGQVNAEDQ